MKDKTQLKAGLSGTNHSETVVAARPAGLAVKTQLKAGMLTTNHSENVVAARPAGWRSAVELSREPLHARFTRLTTHPKPHEAFDPNRIA